MLMNSLCQKLEKIFTCVKKLKNSTKIILNLQVFLRKFRTQIKRKMKLRTN
ncbi:hypothetical protein AHAS_Ahas13G0126700 [Arachis hypogaea]